jgi:hypothetical protein
MGWCAYEAADMTSSEVEILRADVADLNVHEARAGVILQRLEIERLQECLRCTAKTVRQVASYGEAGEQLPEWLAQDCRITLAHIGATIKENTL